MTVGFAALARTTFDIEFAAEMAQAAHRALSRVEGIDLMGDPDPVTDIEPAVAAARSLPDDLDAMVVFQSTFADTRMIGAIAANISAPLVLWATPENRTGKRLRLNSFCGINLAGYLLARTGIDYRWVYREPSDNAAVDELATAIAGGSSQPARVGVPTMGQGPVPDLGGKVVGLIGTRPDGFEPCDYDARALLDRLGVSVDTVELSDWFDAASRAAPAGAVSTRTSLARSMIGLDDVDQASVDKSIRLHQGASDLVAARGWNGVATRCWPECFTEFGGAACAGNSLLTSSGTPGCCEADVMGVVTALLLQEAAGSPPLVADLIDLDRSSNTAAFWHCGLAPQEMAASKPIAGVHSNRKMPLLNEFALRSGRITIGRVSQSRGQLRLLIGAGEMLDVPLPFAGTSGVARLATPVDQVLDTVMSEGLEHHYGIVYGDHDRALRSYAADRGLSVIEL